MAKKNLSFLHFISFPTRACIHTRAAFPRFARDFERRRSEFYRISTDLILFAQSRNKTDDP